MDEYAVYQDLKPFVMTSIPMSHRRQRTSIVCFPPSRYIQCVDSHPRWLMKLRWFRAPHTLVPVSFLFVATRSVNAQAQSNGKTESTAAPTKGTLEVAICLSEALKLLARVRGGAPQCLC